MEKMRFWVLNKEDGADCAFYFDTDEERARYINGRWADYYIWEQEIDTRPIEWI